MGPRHLGAAKAAGGQSEHLPGPPGGDCVLRGGMAEGFAPGSPTTKPALGTWNAGGHAACVRHSSLCSCSRQPPEMRRPQHGRVRQLRRASAVDGRRFTYHWGGEGQKGFLLLGDPVALVQEHSVLEEEARVRSATRAAAGGAATAPPGMLVLFFLIPLSVFFPNKVYICRPKANTHTHT